MSTNKYHHGDENGGGGLTIERVLSFQPSANILSPSDKRAARGKVNRVKSKLADSSIRRKADSSFIANIRHYGILTVIGYYLDSFKFNLILALVVLLAISMSIAEMFGVDPSSLAAYSIDLMTSIFFATEVLTRLAVYGPKRFFSDFLCIIDLCVSIIDWINFGLLSKGYGQIVLLRILRAARLSKMTRFGRLADYKRTQDLTMEDEKNKDGAGHPNAFHPVSKDHDGRIYAYSPDILFSFGFIRYISGTVLGMIEIHIQFVLLAVLTSVWAANICPMSCDPELNSFNPNAELDGECHSCVTGFSLEYGTLFGSLVAFLLGLFVSLTFERWLKVKQMLSAIMEEKNNNALYLTNFCVGSDVHSAQFRIEYVRYLNLSMSLWYLQARNEPNNLEELTAKGLLFDKEVRILQDKSDKYNIVYVWLGSLLNNAADRGLIRYPNSTVPYLHTSLASQRFLTSEVFMHLETQIPYTYAHLLTLIVKIHLLMTTASAGTLVGHGLHEHQGINIFWGYIIIFISNLVLEGLLRIHVVLYDPFGDDACDFPLPQYEDYLLETTQTIVNQINAPNNLPFDLYNKDNNAQNKNNTGPELPQDNDRGLQDSPQRNTLNLVNSDDETTSNIFLTSQLKLAASVRAQALNVPKLKASEGGE
jgi:hypothetical protein